MRRAACFPESCQRGTSTKLGTNRIQSRVWRATASSRRRQNFQNSADSTAMSSLHPAFFTLCLRVLKLAVLNTWHLVCFAKGMGHAFTRGFDYPVMYPRII